MSDPLSDTDLMRRVRQRDQQALSALYSRYGAAIYSLAMRMLQNQTQAEEVTQDIFLRVWERADRWDSERGKLSSWLLTMTRYASIDRIRSENRRPLLSEIDLDEMPQLVSQMARVDEPRWQDGQLLRRLLGELPREQSELIEKAFFGGMTHTDLSESMNLPLGTVKTRIRLGLQKLKGLWLDAAKGWDSD